MPNRVQTLLIYLSVFALAIFEGCNSSGGGSSSQQSVPKGSYGENIKGMVEIHTFDHYNRAEKEGFGFFIDRDLVVTNLDWIKGAYKAKITPPGAKDFKDVRGYTVYDHNLNLVVLKVKRNNPNHLGTGGSMQQPDTLYTLKRPKRNLFVVKGKVDAYVDQDSVSFWPVPDDLRTGKPAFRLNHEFMGIVQERMMGDSLSTVVLSKKWIASLLKKQSDQPKSIYDLRTKTDKVYISHKKVSGFRIKTNMGNIVIRLYDETPGFRDNFIKLVSDQFYDSLLVHRVLKDFLIQTGAADSKYADKDDVVGWQGPGYNLPTNIIPSLYHKRGAIAASKLPADRNPGNRSDGSQFFIISGRVFTNEELDDIEEEKGFRFTPSQREVYTTAGGAPYLDGDYTVFGEVVSGMDVVDRIASVETYGEDRPVNDIRIKTIEIIRK
ncbi:peptidylprolyl isomerase [Marinilabilia rubra]|uniref:peptidylprolyl isomerase n=1 Tax=Marinilabilia rubra TaxID=2162893 RepID=A0A2U2BD08_9BACT|nr:peptidylprolyl isomerase [Marinilabilia rubra]PWE00949.1 peptidylprolyl isomerase [Marinilabilia rubra]